jgi:hypothetical protein
MEGHAMNTIPECRGWCGTYIGNYPAPWTTSDGWGGEQCLQCGRRADGSHGPVLCTSTSYR